MTVIGKNARGQVTFDGVPRFLLGIYDSNFAGSGSQDLVGHLNARQMQRFANKIDLYHNLHTGTVGNGLRLANAVVQYNMHSSCIGNSFGYYVTDVNDGFDPIANPTYTTVPEGTGKFRDLFKIKPRALGYYAFDEPNMGGYFHGNGSNKVFSILGEIFGPADITVFVNEVLIPTSDYVLTTGTSSAGPTFTVTFDTAPPSGTYNVRLRRSTIFDSALQLYALWHSDVPNLPAIGVFLGNDYDAFVEWGHRPISDWMGADCYVIGTGVEGALNPTYGYMTYQCGEAFSMSRYYGQLNNKVPVCVLQFLRFGSQARSPEFRDFWAHMCIALAELRGVGCIWWWAFGTQLGAVHQEPFITYGDQAGEVDGIKTTFRYTGVVYNDEDVWVKYGQTMADRSTYVVNGIGDIVNTANWTVTFNTPPTVGTVFTVTNRTHSLAEREQWYQYLETMSSTIKSLESIMITPDNPSLITNNSTWLATAIAWRIQWLQYVSQGGSDVPTWLFGLRVFFLRELAKLTLPVPDTSLSNYMLDQRGDFRTASWEVGDTGLIIGYNHHPDPRTYTLTWHRNITRVEVIGEFRDVPVSGAGNSFTDTGGGASTLRQGPFHNGHIYKLYLGPAAQTARPRQIGSGAAFAGQIPSCV